MCLKVYGLTVWRYISRKSRDLDRRIGLQREVTVVIVVVMKVVMVVVKAVMVAAVMVLVLSNVEVVATFNF